MNTYTPLHYQNKLLLLERKLITLALKREKGIVKNAHKLLCPKGQYYTYNALVRVIRKHGINKNQYKL